MNFDIPQQPQKHTKVLNNFLGVDFTSILPDERRATNMINLINNNGYLETRPGYAQVGNTFTGLKINGVWNIDASTNIFIVHAGTKLYESDATFTTVVELFSGMSDAISQAVYINNKLVIFDGTRAIVYGQFGVDWSAAFLDTVGYVPTTAISRNPDGVQTTSFEKPNLASKLRINHFLADGTSTVYKLDATPIDAITPIVSKLNVDGTTSIVSPDDYTYSAVNGTVTFDTAPTVSPAAPADNIFIRFSVTNNDMLNNLNKCTICTTYGYDGNNNRVFISGNSSYPNIDWYSQVDDGTYFPDSNYTQIGYQPIVAYCKLNDGTMAVLKNISDTDDTIYYRTSALFGGEEVFPVNYGVKSYGCVSKYATDNLLNDPLILTNEGVFGLVGSSYKEKFADERSYFIKNKLLAETNLQNAVSIVYRGKYYLAINNHVYVSDSRYKTRVKDGMTSDFQYEWYYWENVPVRVWFKYNNELYFGTSDGKIAKFNVTNLDYTTPITCRWESAFLDLSSITLAKTIKQVTVISKPSVPSAFELGYVTDDGSTSIVTKTYGANSFPRTLQEKEKIKRFMFVKFYLTNNTDAKLNFYQIGADYIYSGKYRGE